MNLRTTFTIDPSGSKISYDTPVMFTGSCFAAEMGAKMNEGKMTVLINPTGVVYNPVSAGNTIEAIIERKTFTQSDLYSYKGVYLSFLHYTGFSSEDDSKLLAKINTVNVEACNFLKRADFLFITFGTAIIYRLKETGLVVSNCHKIPSSYFTREILTTDQITSAWNNILDKLYSFNPGLRVIFTISPVRHWKDGAHGNQISKSILFLAVENLLSRKNISGYFPAYELVMDDLRDYRYYAEDMLHLSKTAVDYIWNNFTDCYFDSVTKTLWKEVGEITRAKNHRFLTDSGSGKRAFAENMLKKIAETAGKNSKIDLSEEKEYFQNLISKQRP